MQNTPVILSETRRKVPSTVPAPILRLLRPFQQFLSNEASGGLLLLLCSVVALVWANSPWEHSYHAVWHTQFQVGLGAHTFAEDLQFWVDDLLMVLFFFVVGLEIKREMLVGELASPRKAALPILAATGGVIVPALIYTFLNYGTPDSHGWGIPMATDIAFALGVLVLLGDRVPPNLKVFLAALAIVDDIAAVIVIAIFYTPHISWISFGAALFCVALLIAINRLGVRHPLPYALLGIALWSSVWRSGIHPTIAGVVLAFTIPAHTALHPDVFVERCRRLLNRFERAASKSASILNDSRQQSAIEALEDSCERVQAPLHRFETALLPWVTFAIIPIFALANAGVTLAGNFGAAYEHRVTLGVLLGLLLGKPIGITLASWLSVRAKWAALPPGVGWNHIHGAAWLGGIGFTMSLFVAGLSFHDPHSLVFAKLGVLSASLCAGLVGASILRRASPHHRHRSDASPA